MTCLEKESLQELTPEDYEKGRIEIAFLLDAFASTIDNIMGGNTAPVGRIAGRDTAGKLPIELADPTFEEVIDILRQQLQAGFEIVAGDGQLLFRRCIIREMCQIRRKEPGAALCRLFHAYFDGMANGLFNRPVKSTIMATGEECRLRTEVQ